MAAGTKKSVNVTNIEAAPIAVLDRRVMGSGVSIDEVEVATTNVDDIGDKILMCPVPANAVIRRVVIKNDDLDSHATPTLAVDVGLYYSGIGHLDNTKTSGTVVAAGCIATAITTLQAANVSGVDVRNEAADIDTVDLEAWALAGLSSNPMGVLYVGLTLTAAAATAAAGGIKMMVEYQV